MCFFNNSFNLYPSAPLGTHGSAVERARTIENIGRIRMDVARASGDEIWTKSDIDRENLILIEKSFIFDVGKSF